MSTTAAPLAREPVPQAAATYRSLASASGPTSVAIGRALQPDHGRPAIESLQQQYGAIRADVGNALDRVHAKLRTHDYGDLTAELIDLLQILKESFGATTWRDAVLPAARAHAIMDLVHECPFTSHSFARPRGYPGDAGLLDFVYRHPAARPATDSATAAGRTVMDFTVNVSACEAVRRRKDVLAARIDAAAERSSGAEVLAIACGHLREAEGSVALKEGRLGRFVATDQDATSLATVSGYRDTISQAIDVRNLSVRDFIAAKHGLGRFDLVYAAGLYDYLDARIAARLTARLFALLKSGGRLLVPNFLHGVKEEAYMEVYMDWYLLYRSRAEIEAFADEIPAGEIARVDYVADDSGSIGYLEIERA